MTRYAACKIKMGILHRYPFLFTGRIPHSLVNQFAHLMIIAIEVNQTMVLCIIVHLNRFHFAKENAVRTDVVHVNRPEYFGDSLS